MQYDTLKKIAYILIAAIVFLFCLYIRIMFEIPDINQKEPIRTIFLSKSTDIKPTMRKVLQMENIRVYQYSDSLGTTTIFASEFDFLSNTQSQGK
jgi:hypothetical protein